MLDQIKNLLLNYPVESAFGLTAAVMIGFAVTSLRDLRRAQKALARQEALKPARRRRTADPA